jgi:glycosyltransferase involved in cell wall biosynthesis
VKISIIIPTFNREVLLKRTLLSIEKQKTDVLYEVIIVDNGSIDSTKILCESFRDRISNLIYIYDDEPGSLTGRHKGFERSTGSILCFLDDDIELNQNYIQNLANAFEVDIHIATGPSFAEFEISPPDWLSFFWEEVPEGKYCSWLSLLDFGDQDLVVDPNYVWSQNFCIRRETLIELGGFHPDYMPEKFKKFQGDGETGLTIKAAAKDYKAIYTPGLSINHYVTKERLNIDYFKKRAYFQGICESFTKLREISSGKKGLKEIILSFAWLYYYKLKKFYKKLLQPALPQEIKNHRIILKAKEKEGFDFHQNAFNEDLKVKEWVLKENYWNYKLNTEELK